MESENNLQVNLQEVVPDGIVNRGNTCYASAAIQIYQKMCQVCCIPTENIDTKNFKNEQSDSCEALRLILELAGGK
jgi:ubiquitin C-terminal hydrolase